MLRQRILVTVVLLPVGLWIFALGGWLFAVAMAGVLALAAREYAGLFQRGGLRPSAVLLVAGAAALVLARQARGFDDSAALLAGLALAAVGIGDSAAYFVGRAYGRHKMAPRLSPKKSWEGYAAGVVGAALAGAGLGGLYRFGFHPAPAGTAAR